MASSSAGDAPPLLPPPQETWARFKVFMKLMRRPENAQTRVRMVVLTLLMIGVPLAVFYGSAATVFSGFEPKHRLMYAGFASLAAVNLVAVAFVALAFFSPEGADEEAEETTPRPKQD